MEVLLVTLLLDCCPFVSSDAHQFVIVNTTAQVSDLELPHFWSSTGFSPPSEPERTSETLLSDDVAMSLALIGAVPNRGITHVRIHWLLNMITVSNSTKGVLTFNFEHLDKLLSWMQTQDLSPGFELMGNPSGCFHDFGHQIKLWSALLRSLLDHCIGLFGRTYVESWRFETLNEPDLAQYNLWNLTLENYLLYVTETESILQSYNLPLWGPAGLFKDPSHHPLCWGARQLCKTNCPFSVVSYHAKGDGVVSKVVDRGVAITHLFNDTTLPFANNEADPLSGWWKCLSWRADVRYAAAVIKIVIVHIYQMQRYKLRISAISSDNAFLSSSPCEWTQRTLFARYHLNDSNVQVSRMFKKPVYSALTLLSLLGNVSKAIQYQPGNPGFSFVATSEGSRSTILLVLNRDTLENNTARGWKNVRILVNLSDTDRERKGRAYLLDNMATNPWRQWKRAGAPVFPGKVLSRKLRWQEEPKELDKYNIPAHTTQFGRQLRLRIPSVLLINICTSDTPSPGRVTRLRYFTNGIQNEILLLWSDKLVQSRCLSTYIVEYRENSITLFKQITNRNILSRSYLFDGCIQNSGNTETCDENVSVKGEYRVCAADYWDKKGPFSNTLTID